MGSPNRKEAPRRVDVADRAATNNVVSSPRQLDGDFSIEDTPGLSSRFSPLALVRGLSGRALRGVMEDGYSEKFLEEFSQRREFVARDGVKLTARVLNPEFLENDEHAIVYSHSLTVPTKRGAELPTVADIAAHGEEAQRAVIAVTTEGLAGSLNRQQLWSLTNFWTIPPRRFELLRSMLPNGKKMIATGASLGGIVSHAMAATYEDEAERSGHMLEVTNVISIASAGHVPLSAREKVEAGKQFVWEEPKEAVAYILAASTRRQRYQRAIECLGSVPLHARQQAAIAFTGLGIIDAPLYGIEAKIPHSTNVLDVTFDGDFVSQPGKRGANWAASEHPDVVHRMESGKHLRLLTLGKEITLEALQQIPAVTPVPVPEPRPPLQLVSSR